jgi:copper transport protein
LFLLCASLISGCGAAHTPSTTLRQASPTPQAAHPFHATLETRDGAFTLTLDISPNRSGTNVFLAHVMDNRTGKPAGHVTITLYTTMQDMAMGTDSIVLHADGPGQFSATSDNLSMAGHWAIGITIQASDQSTHRAGVSFVTALSGQRHQQEEQATIF